MDLLQEILQKDWQVKNRTLTEKDKKNLVELIKMLETFNGNFKKDPIAKVLAISAYVESIEED